MSGSTADRSESGSMSFSPFPVRHQGTVRSPDIQVGRGSAHMEVVISTTPEEAGKLAADAIEELLRRRPDAVLGVATGSSPLIIYDELGRRVAQGSLSLAGSERSCLTSTSGCRQIIRSA